MGSGDCPSWNAYYACAAEYPDTAEFMPPGHPCYALLRAGERHSALVTLSGPASNLLIGTLGLCGILYHRKAFLRSQALTPWQWALVLISFFWSRQIFNFATGVFSGIRKGRFLSGQGDESRLSRYMHWPVETLDTISGLVAALILGIVTFYFVPGRQRITFLAAGIFGSILCIYIWLVLLGPVLLP